MLGAMAAPPSSGSPSPFPEVIAAIDIGTNSIHMVVARTAGNDRFEVITRLKEMVRLGSGQGEMKHLEPDAIDRAVATLTRCRQLADSFDATVFAVATSAVREARNAGEFLKRAWTEAGVDVQVIAGQEEARLIRLGALQALPLWDRDMVLIDVGGEVTVGAIGLEQRSRRLDRLEKLRGGRLGNRAGRGGRGYRPVVARPALTHFTQRSHSGNGRETAPRQDCAAPSPFS